MFKKIDFSTRPKQLVGIQYLRAVAVILVVLDHTTGMAMLPKYFGVDFNILDGWLKAGAVGVDLFFVISGFIIFYVGLNQTTLTAKLDTATFVKHRFVRIVPFLWLVVIGFALLKLFGRGSFPAMEYLRSLTLFPIGKVEPRPLWTLRHEFFFYLLFGFSIIKLNRKWFWLIAWSIVPFIWFGFGFNTILLGTNWGDFLDFIFSRHNITFGIGCLIGYAFKTNQLNYVFETKQGFLLSILIVIPLLIVASLVGLKSASNTFTQVIACGIISGGIVTFAITLISNNSLNFADRIGLLLGDASYSIYLVHSGVLSFMLGIWSKYQPNASPYLLLLTGTILTLSGGVIAHLYIEKPLIKLIKTRFNV